MEKEMQIIAILLIALILGLLIALTANNNYKAGIMHGREECARSQCFE